MDAQVEVNVEAEDYGSSEEAFDVLVSVGAVLMLLLERPQPQYIEHRLRVTLSQVVAVIAEMGEVNQLH